MASLTELHRLQQLALRALTLRELRRLWPALNVRRLDVTYPGWAAAVARLIRDHHGISAALAGRYLRALRAESGVPGEAPLAATEAVPAEQIAGSLAATTVAPIKSATARGVPLAQVAANAFVTSSGAATRMVMDGGRGTIVGSVAADEYGSGWRRITSGRACEFCAMLAGRGAVYSGGTADFASHDHCSCSAEPVYDPSRRSAVREVFTPTERRLSEETRAKNNARVRAFIRDNPGT